MTSNGSRDEEFQPVRHVKDEYKGDVNIVVGEKPGSQRYNELQINKDGGDMSVVHQNLVSQPPHQQPQGSLIHWERFLHVESIKVMLVEDDDSTRHIVTALLRNCNYEVIEAANGFQAWKILEDLSNHIDIVLTEVIMPSLSGIGLLCKIMSHKTRKNIPVIMMSSHDSMGLVFKCLSKGAVDFLLKPIRKNELKNLWQHVWRRCHSSSGSGSGSESSTNAQNSVNSKRSDDSVSIVGDDIRSTHDGSDDASGTQSSWTKQVASPCDSTCGLVIHSAEIKTRDLQGREEQRNYTRKGKELVTEEFEVVKEPKNILDESRETLTDLNGPNKHSEPSAFTRYSTTTSNQKSGDVPKDDMVDPPKVYHIHHHHHVHHYHKQPPGNLEDSSLKKLRACGSSNVLGGGGGNIGNYSLNGSGGSGSKHGSNAVNLESKNMESGGELAGKSGGENRIDQQKSEQRESSLVKFREKRKDGCFQKKVRYKNKKRLAEERPHESS